MRTLKSRSSLVMALALLLSGCGAGNEAKDAVVAPVDNIDRNLKYMQDTKKELQETAKKNSDQADKQIDEILNKK